MSLYALDDNIWFPPVSEALEDGLLAMGGDTSVERLILAYRSGIFPGMKAIPHSGGAPTRVLYYSLTN